MTDFLIHKQRMFDRLNLATMNLRNAIKDKARAQDNEDYWREQVRVINVELKREQVS